TWWDIEPDEATNGKEAVENAKLQQYDLILMDIRMPEMDGYEATSQIRKLPGYKHIHILALTADKNQEARHAVHNNQFDDMLTKPFEPGDLKQRILNHLSAFVIDFDNINDHAEDSIDRIMARKPENSNEQQSPSAENRIKNSSEPSFETSRYEKISGGNKEILARLIENATKALETYQREFEIAAEKKDLTG